MAPMLGPVQTAQEQLKAQTAEVQQVFARHGRAGLSLASRLKAPNVVKTMP